MVMRKCNDCGREAHSTEDLKLFTESKTGLHGRMNLCKPCHNIRSTQYNQANKEKLRKYRQDNKEKRQEYNRKHRQDNIEYLQEYDRKRINFKGKNVRLSENPRTNICSFCGKTEEENRRQQSMHHDVYHDDDPLKDTWELCNSCHGIIGRQLQLNPNYPNIKYSHPYSTGVTRILNKANTLTVIENRSACEVLCRAWEKRLE